MTKAKFIFWILAFVIFVFWAGWGKHGSLSAMQGVSGKKQELLMWLVGSESQAKAIQSIGDKFFEDKDITFRCEAITWWDVHTKYLTSIAGGVVPDIGTMGLTWGTEFGTLGAMVDLAKEFPEDIKKIKEKTFVGLRNSAEYKTSMYGVPFDLSVQVMFYRSDIINKPPATWKELVDLLKSLKSRGKGMIFEWGSMSWIGYAGYLWQAGGDFYNPEGTKLTLDSREAVEALKFFSSLYIDLKVPKARIPIEQGMRSGDFPLAISGNWKIDSLRLTAPELAGKWSIAVLPAGPSGKRTAFLGGRVIGIFNKSKNKKLAWEFIKFLFEPESQIKLYEAARLAQDSYLPSNISAWDNLTMDTELKTILKAQAHDAKGPPSVIGWDEDVHFIEEAIQRVILQGADPQEQLRLATQEIEKQANK